MAAVIKKQNEERRAERGKETVELAALATQLAANTAPSGSKEVSAAIKLKAIIKNCNSCKDE